MFRSGTFRKRSWCCCSCVLRLRGSSWLAHQCLVSQELGVSSLERRLVASGVGHSGLLCSHFVGALLYKICHHCCLSPGRDFLAQRLYPGSPPFVMLVAMLLHIQMGILRCCCSASCLRSTEERIGLLLRLEYWTWSQQNRPVLPTCNE